MFTVALILPYSLISVPVPLVEIRPSTTTLTPPNVTLLLRLWGEYRSLRLHRTNLFPANLFHYLREIVCLDLLISRLALSLLERVVAVENRSYFGSLPIHVFLGSSFPWPARCFLCFTWHSFLKFSLNTMNNTFRVTHSLWNIPNREFIWFNLIRYPILYSYPKSFLIIQKKIWNSTDLFNRSDNFDHEFFSNVI